MSFSDEYSSEYSNRGPDGFYYKSHLDVPDWDTPTGTTTTSSDSGCLGPILLILLVGTIITGGGTALVRGLTDDTPDFRDAARWDGTFECGDDTLGLRLVTKFTGPAERGSAPMQVDVTYLETAPASAGRPATGEELGEIEFTGTFNDSVITLDDVDLDEPERYEASSGRLRVRSNGAAADTISGRMRAPGCSVVELTKSRQTP